MSAPPKKKQIIVCERKRRFPDEMAARAVAMINLQTGGGKDIKYLSIYKCPHCNGWHMTRNKKSRISLVTAESAYTQKFEESPQPAYETTRNQMTGSIICQQTDQG